VAGPDLEPGAAALVDVKDVPAGAQLLAVGASGEPEMAVVEAAKTIHYGCEENQLEIVPVRGAAPLADGPVLLLRAPLAAGWAPAAVAIAAGPVERDHRAWTAGPLALSLDRTDDRHARFEIRAGDRTLHAASEELYFMEGADPHPLDLTGDFLPGIPAPRAVFLLAPDGPALVVLATPGYEGETLHTLLVGGERTEQVDSLSVYLYWCAF
jgi:hypothetical protein